DERRVIAVPDREGAEVVGDGVVGPGAPDPRDAVARLGVAAGGRETPCRQGEDVVVGVRLPRGLCGNICGFFALAEKGKAAGASRPERKAHRVERTEPLRALRACHTPGILAVTDEGVAERVVAEREARAERSAVLQRLGRLLAVALDEKAAAEHPMALGIV